MRLEDLIQYIDGTILTPSIPLNRAVRGACGADLMSDVLASIQPDGLLLTGLCNPQVVRTAQVADVAAIVFVRGKTPDPETVGLSIAEGIPLISTPHGMFELCGRLYQAGLPSLEMPVSD